MFRASLRSAAVLSAAFFTLAACSSHSGALPTAGGSFTQSFAGAPAVLAVPPACKGQKTTSTHSTDKETLLSTGGSLCVPSFAGLGGTIKYPSATPSVSITLTSSTTNYNGKLPNLGSGSPIFYLQIATSGATSFGSNVTAGGGLTGKSIVPGSVYTIYGQATISGFTVNFTPCYSTATSGKYGGVVGGIGSLLKGQNIPSAATGVIEVYAGKSATGSC